MVYCKSFLTLLLLSFVFLMMHAQKHTHTHTHTHGFDAVKCSSDHRGWKDGEKRKSCFILSALDSSEITSISAPHKRRTIICCFFFVLEISEQQVVMKVRGTALLSSCLSVMYGVCLLLQEMCV